MKTLISLTLVILLITPLKSQELMTIGEVFDFEVGDKFQTYTDNPFNFPNADRFEIIDKYSSFSADTIYYVRFHDNYWSSLDFFNNLIYYTETEIDTVKYYDLDSLITFYPPWRDYDSTTMSYYDTIILTNGYCDTLVNGYNCYVGDFEPVYYSQKFGKGIGKVYDAYIDNTISTHVERELFYFEKNGIGCGTPDNTIVSSMENKENSSIIIFPNPVVDKIKINISRNKEYILTIYNSSGHIIDSKRVSNFNAEYNCRQLKKGLYFFMLSDQKSTITKRIIIK